MRLLLVAWLALLLVACTNLTGLQGGSGASDAGSEAAALTDSASSSGDGARDDGADSASTRDGSGEPDSPTGDSALIRGDEGASDTTVPTFTVGGTVTGLASGASVTLQDSGGASLVVTQNGPFVFSSGLETGASYGVTVSSQPSTPVVQTCAVGAGSGTVGSNNVTAVTVTCVTASFTIGGTVSGLGSGDAVVLADDGGPGLTISSNGTFTFQMPIASGAAYSVLVTTQPTSPPQTCTIQAGAGTVANADVTAVSVTCVAIPFTVGGTVTGLAAGDTVTVVDNGGSNLDVTANGTFSFPTPLLPGAAYDVTVFTQPTSPIAQTCTVTSGSGTVADAAVVSVVVTCAVDSYMIGGTVTGLSPGGTVVLQTGSSTVSLSTDGAFAFPAPFASGTLYMVTVLTQPSGAVAQTCSVNAGSGTVQSSDVTGVMVICATNAYTLGGTVTGLATGDTLVLLDEGSSNLMVTASGPFTFAVPLASGAGYTVTLMAQPAGPVTQTCTVGQGSGTVGSGNVNDVAVTCTTTTFTVGGTLTGLASGDSVSVQDSGGAGLMVTGNGAFMFPAAVPSGSPYDVTVSATSGTTIQTCIVGNGMGTVTSANVANVTVTCTTSSFVVGGNVMGLAGGDSVVLENNGGSPIAVGSNESFNFPTPVASGATYDVTVLTDPISPTPQVCSVTNGAGTINNVNITNVQITCAAATLCTKAIATYLFEPNPYGNSVTVASWSMVGGGGGGGGLSEGGAGGGSSFIANSNTYEENPSAVIGYAAGGNGGAPEAGGSTGGAGTVVTSTGPFSLAAGATLVVTTGGGGGGGNDMTSAGDNTGPGGGAGYCGGGGAGNNGYGLGGSSVGGAGNMGGSMGIPGSPSVGGEGGTYAGGQLFASQGGNGVAGGSAKYGGGGGGDGSGGGGGVYGTSGGGGSSGANGAPAPSGGSGGLGANNWSSATSLPGAAGQGGVYVTGGGGGGNAGLVILTYLSPNGSCSL